MRICLDTSAYSHFRRGMQEAVQIVTRARSVVVPSIVLASSEWDFASARAVSRTRSGSGSSSKILWLRS